MKLDSPFFDRLRLRPQDATRRMERDLPRCDWPGCQRSGAHRAPKGRDREGEYWRYCLEHVREYNHGYNYFAGMGEDAVSAYQKDALTGHRPTWRMGMRTAPSAEERNARDAGLGFNGVRWHDPFHFFEELGGKAGFAPEAPDSRLIRNAERKAFAVLALEINASAVEIKSRFKELVKIHHPDANGGDRSTEDRLREIIQAYNYLKSVGFC
jgi:curved DNA-binding protein CbpA